MSKIASAIEKLVAEEVKEAEAKKAELLVQSEVIEKENNKKKSDSGKEIAKMKAECEIYCLEKTKEADVILKEAKDKLKTAEKREEESEAIKSLIKDLDEKIKALESEKKEIESLKADALEKMNKAELTIEQYNKKIDELSKKK